MDKIRESFAGYFRNWGIELPDPVSERGRIEQEGWSIRYIVFPEEDGLPCLEFVAYHRLSNPRHERILSSGEFGEVATFQEGFSFDPSVPGDREAAEARMKAHNAAVRRDLIDKGLN